MKLTNASAIFSTNDTVSHHPQIRLLDDLPDTYRLRNRESVVRCSSSESTRDSRVKKIFTRSGPTISQPMVAKQCDFVKLGPIRDTDLNYSLQLTDEEIAR